MRKLANVLCTISIIAFIVLTVVGIILYGKDPRSDFLFKWITGMLLPVIVPSLSYGFLVLRVDKWKPRTWFTVYSTLLCSVIALMLFFGFAKIVADVPFALRKEYHKTSGYVYAFEHKKNDTILIGEGFRFELSHDFFKIIPFDKSKEYTFIYLPKSKHVIDVFDEDGRSLLMK